MARRTFVGRESHSDRRQRHGEVASVQRARMLSAMIDVSCERGAGSVSVTHVVKRSGVSRRTFYETFVDREDCFVASFEQAVAFARERLKRSWDAGEEWKSQMRNGLAELLGFLDEEPRLGRILIVESLSGGARVTERRGELIDELARVVDQGRRASGAAAALPDLTGEGVVGAVLGVIQARLLDSHRTALVDLTNQLMSMVVLPYLGAAAARRELSRPAPVTRRREPQPERLLSDPFKDAGMRMTYRTARVMMAVADRPGASNREIGETAEVPDQGQISKLLSRLARAGLLTNSGVGPGSGAPNAWTLTSTGSQMVNRLRTHTEVQRQPETRRQVRGTQVDSRMKKRSMSSTR